MYYNKKSDELYHHGILGQKWGIRRFQNKDGTRTAAGKARQTENSQKKGLTDQQKKYLKIGAAVVGTAILAYGGYKLATNPKAREMVSSIVNRNKDVKISEIGDFGGSNSTKVDIGLTVGKTINEIDRTMVSGINKDGWDNGKPPRLTKDYARNCSQTSIAYIMNSVLGMNVTAKGFGGVDEFSGLVQKQGRNKNVFEGIFNGIQKTEIPMNDLHPDSAVKYIKNGTTGILRLQSGEDGHFINYEKDSAGNLTFIDCQNGQVGLFKDLTSKNFMITDVFDCSNATLREDASKSLKYMVK